MFLRQQQARAAAPDRHEATAPCSFGRGDGPAAACWPQAAAVGSSSLMRLVAVNNSRAQASERTNWALQQAQGARAGRGSASTRLFAHASPRGRAQRARRSGGGPANQPPRPRSRPLAVASERTSIPLAPTRPERRARASSLVIEFELRSAHFTRATSELGTPSRARAAPTRVRTPLEERRDGSRRADDTNPRTVARVSCCVTSTLAIMFPLSRDVAKWLHQKSERTARGDPLPSPVAFITKRPIDSGGDRGFRMPAPGGAGHGFGWPDGVLLAPLGGGGGGGAPGRPAAPGAGGGALLAASLRLTSS